MIIECSRLLSISNPPSYIISSHFLFISIQIYIIIQNSLSNKYDLSYNSYLIFLRILWYSKHIKNIAVFWFNFLHIVNARPFSFKSNEFRINTKIRMGFIILDMGIANLSMFDGISTLCDVAYKIWSIYQRRIYSLYSRRNPRKQWWTITRIREIARASLEWNMNYKNYLRFPTLYVLIYWLSKRIIKLRYSMLYIVK